MSSNYSRRAGLGRWIVIGVGGFVFAVFAAVLWYAYVEVMGLGAGGPPPLIRAEVGPIKRTPDDPGGMEIPNRDSAAARVFQESSDGIRRERILPRQDTAMIEPEPPAEPAAPVIAPGEPTPETATTPPAAPAPAATVPPAAAAPVEKLAAREPEPAPPAASAVTPPAAARPSVTVTNRPPTSVLTPPQATPRPPATPPAPPRALTTPPPVTPPPAQTAARPPAAATPPARSAPAASPTFRVQLGAFRSDAAANQAWIDLQRRLQAPLGGLRPTVLEAKTSAGTFYRLQAGPLPNRDGAVQACTQVKAGGNDCFIVGPLP